MKHYSLLVIAFLSFTVLSAQNFPVDEGTGKITYMETVSSGSLTAAEIYNTTKEWAKTKELSTTEDEANKKLVYSGSFKVSYRPSKGTTNEEGTVSYTLHIGAKDGKYRYILVDLVHKGSSGDGGKLENAKPDCGTTIINNNSWSKIKQQAHTQANELIESLSKKIKEVQNDPTKNDDW